MSIEFRVDGRPRRAALWAPPGFDPQVRCGLIVFLHAYEERGDDFEHLGVGIGPALEERPDLYDCPVLLPQCPADHVWAPIDCSWAEGCASAADHVPAAIEAACGRLDVDPARITLTGASMGGYGTFALGAAWPDRFAALGPVCGGGDPATAAALAAQAIQAWHGTDDDVVPITESREMVDAIRAAGGAPELHEIAHCGHDVWDRAYRDAAFARFLTARP